MMTAKERIAELRSFLVAQNALDEDGLWSVPKLLAHLDALEKELEGVRERGLIDAYNRYWPYISEGAARSDLKIFYENKIISRRAAGPWEEEK